MPVTQCCIRNDNCPLPLLPVIAYIIFTIGSSMCVCVYIIWTKYEALVHTRAHRVAQSCTYARRYFIRRIARQMLLLKSANPHRAKTVVDLWPRKSGKLAWSSGLSSFHPRPYSRCVSRYTRGISSFFILFSLLLFFLTSRTSFSVLSPSLSPWFNCRELLIWDNFRSRDLFFFSSRVALSAYPTVADLQFPRSLCTLV